MTSKTSILKASQSLESPAEQMDAVDVQTPHFDG